MTMCVICFNSQWRSVVIGTVSSVFCLLVLLVTIGAKDVISQHCLQRLLDQNCIQKFSFGDDGDDVRRAGVSSYSLSHSRDDSECVYLVFDALFPWPLWTVLGLYFLLNVNLVISAVYRWLPGVTAYLALDAVFVGLLAASLCLSFFPKGLTRITLLTILFPLFSLALCAWMTVFGLYLRLEDKARRKKKRMAAIKALEEEKRKRKTKELDDILLIDSTHGSTQNFVNLAFDANAP